MVATADSEFSTEALLPGWGCTSPCLEMPPGSEYASTSVAVGGPVTFVYGSSHDMWQFADFAAYQACDFGRAILSFTGSNTYYLCCMRLS